MLASNNSILSETKLQYSVVHDMQTICCGAENDWQHISSIMLYRYKKMKNHCFNLKNVQIYKYENIDIGLFYRFSSITYLLPRVRDVIFSGKASTSWKSKFSIQPAWVIWLSVGGKGGWALPNKFISDLTLTMFTRLGEGWRPWISLKVYVVFTLLRITILYLIWLNVGWMGNVRIQTSFYWI